MICRGSAVASFSRRKRGIDGEHGGWVSAWERMRMGAWMSSAWGSRSPVARWREQCGGGGCASGGDRHGHDAHVVRYQWEGG
jgi:hypothetical protein